MSASDPKMKESSIEVGWMIAGERQYLMITHSDSTHLLGIPEVQSLLEFITRTLPVAISNELAVKNNG